MRSPFLRPNDTSTGGAAGGGVGGLSSGSGRVMVANPVWPLNRPFPWPYPASATQGAVGGAGGVGTVSVSLAPYYGPFNYYWPYAIPDQYFRGLPNIPLRS
jgi:hypothetical protein